jgi:nucleoside-diphosphate-sugar epimerase
LTEDCIVVTGASGFVGRALCEELVTRGYQVRAVVRDSSDAIIHGCEMVRIPVISEETNWTHALSGVATVIHLAARVHVMQEKAINPLDEFRRVNVVGTEHLARSAAANGVKRLIFVSSIKVNGEITYDDQKFSETNEPSPQDPYGMSKFEAEQALRIIAEETGLEVVIVRPPLIYGTGVKGNFTQMLKVIAKRIPLPLASVHNRRSLIYIKNLVDALIACTTHPAAAGQTYLISDGEDISTPDLLRRLGGAMGCPPRLFPCPLRLLKLAGHLTGRSSQIERLLGSLQVDSGKIRRELNWNPPYSLQQGLQATAVWYRNSHL